MSIQTAICIAITTAPSSSTANNNNQNNNNIIISTNDNSIRLRKCQYLICKCAIVKQSAIGVLDIGWQQSRMAYNIYVPLPFFLSCARFTFMCLPHDKRFPRNESLLRGQTKSSFIPKRYYMTKFFVVMNVDCGHEIQSSFTAFDRFMMVFRRRSSEIV